MPFNRLAFNAAYLDWPVLSSNVNLLPLFEQQADAMLETLNGGDRYTQKVTYLIAEHLKGERENFPKSRRLSVIVAFLYIKGA
ncbi:hypothetical protein HNI00_08980 [Thermoleptolyngbya oregonensis NK1-22]|uniref:Uncharacterized protein n=1 Tax=Thermoleptolyngbya oregonensis NK1-22 TaxID=2547457 RepID=A0AA96Y3N8_9CYAN|nr:hypothetical protein [Thermoleptolyngbya oregonensis]WOB43276.1 hypothetical protein HNI00_08980 [Thermoleptolyngbya oregonensis NK1-22]